MSKTTNETTGRTKVGSSRYYLGQALQALAAAMAPSNIDLDGTTEQVAQIAHAQHMLSFALDAVAVEDGWAAKGSAGAWNRNQRNRDGAPVLHGLSTAMGLIQPGTMKNLAAALARRVDDLTMLENAQRKAVYDGTCEVCEVGILDNDCLCNPAETNE